MNDELVSPIKLLGANVASWFTTIAVIELKDVGTLVTIAAALGSLALSLTSIWWIRKQANYAKQDHATRD